ncbi:MAG TPA: maleylacetoacetate isomerase [Caulobacteraceae bacterium]|jgi:maleylacetoacetate isomerase|nr:maleylacetoacetate isomerase [Caulobacteraceae bacterium]
MTSAPLTFYGFWRSMASYRVRVALGMKGLAAQEIPLDVLAGDQFKPDYLAINPEGAVPALVEGDQPALTQSTAILEYLEERWPDPPLLPADPRGRARVRSLCAVVVSDTHPLLVPRVRAYLREHGFSEEAGSAWSTHWMTRAAQAIEARLARDTETGAFCHGELVTLADICLASLFTLGKAGGFVLRDAPTIEGILERCEATEAFQQAMPKRQAPD